MQIFGTSFSLTLGAWRLRLTVDIDDVCETREAREVAAARRNTAPRATPHVTVHRN